MPGTDYKVSLDSSGLQNGLKTFNAAQSIMGSFSSLLRGDLVGAATQAKNAMMALRAAFLANPYVAIAAAVAAVAAALATVMWRKHTADVEAHTEAMKKLTEAQANYNKTVAEIRFKNADAGGKVEIRKREMEEARSNLEAVRKSSATTETEIANRAAKITDAEATFLQAEDAWLDALKTAAEKRLKASADEETERNNIVQRVRTASEQEERARADQLSAIEQRTEQIKKQREGRGQSDQDRLAELQSRQGAIASEFDGTAQQRRLDQFAGGGEMDAPLFDLGDPVAVAKAKQQMEELGLEIDALSDRIQKAADAAHDAKIDEELKNEADKASAIASVKKDEADYAMSKLSPQEQLAGINLRMKDIMGKKGWEQDATAREEKLALEKRRDDLQEQLRKQKEPASPKEEPPSRSVTAASVEDRFQNYYEGDNGKIGGRSAPRDVIRMAGSSNAGFIAGDGVRRMAGSLAGSFGDRLSSSAFAKTREQIDTKRMGLAAASGAKVISRSTGNEQPVDIGMEALNYLKTIADNSSGI